MNQPASNGDFLILLTIFIGFGVIILFFLLKWIKQEQTNKGNTKNEKSDKIKSSSTEASGKHGKKEQQAAKPKKKQLTERETRRTARANEKGFNHPWLLATLKGHTGRVLDMDFSANGKYLVSCGDEDPDPGGAQSIIPTKSSSDDTSSESNKENSSSPPSAVPSPKGLSRRQRKNRKRDNSTPAAAAAAAEMMVKDNKGVNKNNNKKCKNKFFDEVAKMPNGNRHLDVRGRGFIGLDVVKPLDEFKRMTMPEDLFVRILKDKYCLSKEEMAILGYPLRPDMRMPEPLKFFHCEVPRKHNLDVHAEEFVPKSDSGDSGNGSSSSSEEDSSSGSEANDDISLQLAPGTIKRKDVRAHVCVRCGSFFCTTSKKYITKDQCSYHPGKIETLNGAFGPMNYSCCRRPPGSPGCDFAQCHVWPGPKEPTVNSSYVETDPPRSRRHMRNYGVYSLDCEMSFTVTGLEVVKITVVDISGKPVYNEYVKPVNKIVDFNTRFSGISEEDFLKHPTKSLVQVQRDLKKFICSETVLVGHGLENDLKGLKIIHKTIVDTAFTFPHFKGLPYKRSLKSLVHTCLNREIQNGTQGHDSFEDARACMELMLFRLRRDFPNNF